MSIGAQLSGVCAVADAVGASAVFVLCCTDTLEGENADRFRNNFAAVDWIKVGGCRGGRQAGWQGAQRGAGDGGGLKRGFCGLKMLGRIEVVLHAWSSGWQAGRRQLLGVATLPSTQKCELAAH